MGDLEKNVTFDEEKEKVANSVSDEKIINESQSENREENQKSTHKPPCVLLPLALISSILISLVIGLLLVFCNPYLDSESRNIKEYCQPFSLNEPDPKCEFTRFTNFTCNTTCVCLTKQGQQCIEKPKFTMIEFYVACLFLVTFIIFIVVLDITRITYCTDEREYLPIIQLV